MINPYCPQHDQPLAWCSHVRALTDEDKEEILARLGVLWEANPTLRLGQLIGNVYAGPNSSAGSMYNVEDYVFIEVLEANYRRS